MKYIKQYEHWIDNIIEPPEINKLSKAILKFLRSNYKDKIFNESKNKSRRGIYYENDNRFLDPPYEFMEIYFTVKTKRTFISFNHKPEMMTAEKFLSDIIKDFEVNPGLSQLGIYIKRADIPKIIKKIEEESKNYEDYKVADKYNL